MPGSKIRLELGQEAATDLNVILLVQGML